MDSGGSQSFSNPIALGSIQELFVAILNVVIVFSIPVVVFFLILAGFHYVTARGNPEKIAQANRSLLFGVIGGVIIVGAVTILGIVSATIEAF